MKKQFTVKDHECFLQELWGNRDTDYDPDFNLVIESPPAQKSSRELDRVNRILDDLAAQDLRKGGRK